MLPAPEITFGSAAAAGSAASKDAAATNNAAAERRTLRSVFICMVTLRWWLPPDGGDRKSLS
jgi:hypothetical protein